MRDELGAQQDCCSDGENKPDSADPKPDVIHTAFPALSFVTLLQSQCTNCVSDPPYNLSTRGANTGVRRDSPFLRIWNPKFCSDLCGGSLAPRLGQQGADLGVAGLIEIPVELAHRVEGLRGLEANHLIGLSP